MFSFFDLIYKYVFFKGKNSNESSNKTFYSFSFIIVFSLQYLYNYVYLLGKTSLSFIYYL